MLREIRGSGLQGQGLASQIVCSAALPDSPPAFCMVITYELGAEKADGQDINTKTWTQRRLHRKTRHRKRGNKRRSNEKGSKTNEHHNRINIYQFKQFLSVYVECPLASQIMDK